MTTAPSESPSNLLTLRVGQFEGPLDLLLHLCRTNEIDLAALPVRAITDQYLTHLEAIVEVLREGSQRARQVAQVTMDEVHRVVPLTP